ncbi:MAG: DUF924 family protein [Wenzhouxiangella sp.]
MVKDDILQFWFETLEPPMWWRADPVLDAQIKARYSDLLSAAAAGELFEWRVDARGRLAEIIVLDQFSRNIHRDTPGAFAQDPMALVLAQEAVSAGYLAELKPIECAFLLLPYMHSESRRIHVEAERLYAEHAPEDNYQFELKHKLIIDRFGRYPHRNRILGRTSTAEEIEFLKQPGSSF